MDNLIRGRCLIINNMKFCDGQIRWGSDKDAARLKEVFDELHFIVTISNDLIDTEMRNTLKDFADMDHSDYDCFVCCVLTHGGIDGPSGTNFKSVTIKELTENFHASKCKSLGGKPKLFFLQACQGNKHMKGVAIETDNGLPSAKTDTNAKEIIPDEADFLLGYATSPGCVSYRDGDEGSYYIQTLCDLLEKYALTGKEDIVSILTMVNNEVAKVNFQGGTCTNKQMPAPVLKLRGKVFLK